MPKPPRSKLLLAVGLVALVACLVGALGWWKWSRSDVAFIGDSITAQIAPKLEDQLRADPDRVRATPGIRLDEMVGVAKEVSGLEPPQVIINLGTNDVMAGETTAPNIDELNRMLDLFPKARCIHLVTINEHMYSNKVDAHGGAVAFNNELRKAAASHPNVKLIDWAAIVNDYDAGSKPDGPITFDTVHPTEYGMQRLVDAYRAAIDDCG